MSSRSPFPGLRWLSDGRFYTRDAAAIARSPSAVLPLAVTGGQGAWLIDDAGRRILASWGGEPGTTTVARAVAVALASQAGAGHISPRTCQWNRGF
jgi:hypothetical protein